MRTLPRQIMQDLLDHTDEYYKDLVEEFDTKKMSSKDGFAHGFETGVNIGVRKLWDALPVTFKYELNKRYGFEEVYRKHGGNLTNTAKELGVHRQEAYHMAERYGLIGLDTTIPVPYVWSSGK